MPLKRRADASASLAFGLTADALSRFAQAKKTKLFWLSGTTSHEQGKEFI
jgi:hypothetical protein